jgi:hypothetical protein
MSIGYIPKKRAKARKQRRLRKKYKNFSCSTCQKSHNLSCPKRYQSYRYGGILVTTYENCPDWKAHKPQKPEPVTPEKKKPWYRRK